VIVIEVFYSSTWIDLVSYSVNLSKEVSIDFFFKNQLVKKCFHKLGKYDFLVKSQTFQRKFLFTELVFFV